MYKFLILTVVAFSFAITSCTTTAPVTSNSNFATEGDDAIPPSFAQFPDVPFPEKTLMNLDETKILGSGENWMGSIVFTAPYNPSSMFDFYMAELPKFSWNQIAVVRSKVSHMTYKRANRVIQILISSTTTGASEVSLTVTPGTGGK